MQSSFGLTFVQRVDRLLYLANKYVCDTLDEFCDEFAHADPTIGICCNSDDSCYYHNEATDPFCTDGYCPLCNKKTMVSAFLLAELDKLVV